MPTGKRKGKKIKNSENENEPRTTFTGWLQPVVPSFTKNTMIIFGTKDVTDQQAIGNSAYQELLDRLCGNGNDNDEQSLTHLNYYL